VKRITADGFEADVSKETLDRTTLGTLPVGAALNLERSLALGARLGGHLVTGHVDGVCALASRRPVGEAVEMTFSFDRALAPLVAQKGSVAINGVSLTVNGVRDGATPTFHVAIIPHTQDVTSFGALAVGATANLEVDLLARYVLRMLTTRGERPLDATASDAAWLERLQRGGYL
jgi:riboflavin synthase